eukprot:scpid66064/ scgid27914/ 
MAFNLSAEGFMMCFTRFCRRRGTPKEVQSDNGTNFVAVDRLLRDVVEAIDMSQVTACLTAQNTVWRFNPPRSPHHGGFSEALIKSAKRAIHATPGNASFNGEELQTAFVQAEGRLNSRLLTAVSTDAEDLSPLTPQHFLVGHQKVEHVLEMAADYDAPVHPRHRWEVVQRTAEQTWRRWLKEFVPSLNVRQRCHRVGRTVKKGDVVLYMAQDTPRGTWPLGRVLNVFPGPDGHVRVVHLMVRAERHIAVRPTSSFRWRWTRRTSELRRR